MRVYPRPYGNYVLLERVATGGMSQIDLARRTVSDTDFVRLVVIKRIKAERSDDDAFVRMFKDEARITAELRHANIAQVYDFGRQEDEYYLALEYVPGVDIRRIITTLADRHQRMPLRVVLKVCVDVLDALAYAHTRTDALGKPMEIVHRDVNPRNIMVSLHGEVKLIDFGVARATNRLERTATDHVKGKLAYMAPEQVRGGRLDHRVDLFAVGLTMHEMISGFSPFKGLDQVAIVHRLANARVPDLPAPPELRDPRALFRVHRRALQKDPGRRFEDAAAYRDALLEVAEPLGGVATREELMEFLRMVDPDLEVRLQDKISQFSVPDLPKPDLNAHTRPIPSPDSTGTLERPASDAGHDVSAATLTRRERTQTAMISAAVASFGVGIGVVAMAVVGLVAFFIVRETQSATDASPVLTPPPVVVQPAPVPEAAPEPITRPSAPVVQTRPEPAVPERPPETTRLVEELVARPEPTVEPALEPVVEPEPVEPEPEVELEPEPVVVAPEPEPEPEPEPVATETGMLRVTSAEKGRDIYVAGKRVGKTPLQFEHPVGTWELRVEGYDAVTVTLGADAIETRTFR